jgi:MoaA/NifB/PqqE/SkfB family radical SAM enzyme
MHPYLTQPREVALETLALCNARCTFCPYPTLDRKGTEMPMQLIERLIGEMSEFALPFYFSPFKVNEPFLDRRVIGICQHVNTQCPQAMLRLFTNGQPLTGKLIAQIAELQHVEHLWISLNSHDADEYRELMGLDFVLTRKRLDALHESLNWFPHPVVISRVSGTDPWHNLQFMTFVKNRWPRFRAVIIKRDGWLGYVEPSDPRIPHRHCERWFEMSICADGKASLCCMDGTGEYSVGDVREQSLLEVYNQPALFHRRENMTKRQEVHPCRTCTY